MTAASRRFPVALVSALLLPVIAGGAPAPASASGQEVQLLVKFVPGTSSRSTARELAAVGGRNIRSVPRLGVHVVRVPTAALSRALGALNSSPAVRYAERDLTRRPSDTTPNDPLFPIGATWGGEWGSFKTEAPKAWDVNTGSSQAIIADIDSGVAGAHPDLAGQLVAGENVLNGTSDTTDTYGHGTWVGGVIAAASNNGAGVAGYCWGCRLMPVKVYSSSSGAYDSNIATGITWAVDHGARVLNISLAGPGSSSTLANAVSYARQHGAVVIAAAGNSGCNCAQYPAAYTGVIGVAASDQTDALYSYSNYGDWVDLAAPGQNVTTMLSDPVSGAPYGYGPVGGTSLAAPVVAGIAGLLFSAKPSATLSAVENALFTSVDPVAGTNRVAYGRVNAYKALVALGAGASTVAPVNTTPPSISGTALAGQALAASTGSWSGNPTTYDYQWSRCDATGAGCAALSGATAATYSLTSADVGFTIRVTVTAANAIGSSEWTSASTAVVANAPPPTPTVQTVTYSGSLNGKNTSRSFSVTVGAGMADARLSFSKCSALQLGLSNGASTSGPSVVVLDQTLAAGTYAYTVSGGRCSFSLTVKSPSP